MKEAGLWQRLKRTVHAQFPLARIDRIENGVAEGMPDVQGCINGLEIWCELKYVDSWPVRASTRVLGPKGLRPEQINWHLRQERAGGSSLIVVGIGRETRVTSGAHARTINEWSKQEFLEKSTTLQEMLDALKNDA